jgi:hypothetical protein
MQAPFRIAKHRIPRAARRTERERLNGIADALSEDPNNLAMVACTSCVNTGSLCYYDRERSRKCAECLRHQRDCDGTFSLEEFRKVGEQKKEAEAILLEKERAITQMRRALVEAEEEGLKAKEWLAHLSNVSSRMIQREMMALGVFEELPQDSSVALGSPLAHGPAANTTLASYYYADDPDSVWRSGGPSGTGDVGGMTQSSQS